MTELPTDFGQIVQLIESLYEVGADPRHIQETQSTLLKLQLTPNAFDIAELLLAQESPNCQFFGALTYAIRINSMRPNETGPEQHLMNLLKWLIHLRNKRQSMFVVLKILSSLSTYFARFCRQWQSPVMTVLSVLVQNNAIGQWKSDNQEEQAFVISSASPDDVLLTLKFCQILIEDLYTDNITHKESGYIAEILGEHNLFAFCNLTDLAFNWIKSGAYPVESSGPFPLSQAIVSYGAWVQHMCGERIPVQTEEQLQKCCGPILEFIYFPDEDIMEKAFNCIIDTIRNAPSFWRIRRPDILEILVSFGQRAEPSYCFLNEDNPDWDRSQLMVKLFIVFCQEYMQQYSNSNGLDAKYAQALHYLVVFTRGNPNIHLVDDPLAGDFLSFWTDLAEEFISREYTPQDYSKLQSILIEIVGIYYEKIKLPLQETWDSEKYSQLDRYRLDFCNILEAIYADPHHDILARTISMAVNSITSATASLNNDDYTLMDWTTIEASLYCLSDLNDMSDSSDTVISNLEMIFSSSLWKALTHCHIVRVRQTAVKFLGSSDVFLLGPKGTPYIVPIVEYLFSSLQAQDLALTASRSIQKLCTACEKYLVDFLPQLFNIYDSLNLSTRLENTAHERIISGTINVIEAVSSEQDQMMYIERLVSTLINECKSAFDNGIQHAKETSTIDTRINDRIVSLLKCLAYIVKGLRRIHAFRLEKAQTTIWKDGNKEFADKILEIVRIFSIEQEPFNKSYEICEKCCDILICAFPEKYGIVSLFDIGKVLLYIQDAYKMDPITRCLMLSDLSRSVLNTIERHPTYKEHYKAFADQIFDTFFSPASLMLFNESEIQVANLKLMSQVVLNNHMDVLLCRPELDALFQLAQGTLSTPADRLALKESASFWCSFIIRQPSDQFQASKLQLIHKGGSSLVDILLHKFSGEAPRSDLETYTKVLRRLIVKYPQETNQWLNSWTQNTNLNSTDQQTRNEFIKKLSILRGSPDTAKTVKDYWLSCRRIENYDGSV